MPAMVTHRSNVNSWNCDEMGHLNVRYYVAKADSATPHLAAAVGLGPRPLKGLGVRLRTRDHHIRFIQELLAGSGLYVESYVVHVGEEGIRFCHEIRKSIDESICATVTGEFELVAMKSGVVVPLPRETAERAAELLAPLPRYAEPRGLPLSTCLKEPTLQWADGLALPEICRTVLEPSQCDGNGYILPGTVISSIADGIPNLFRQEWSRHKQAGGDRIGGAAVEYRFVYHRACSSGTLLAIRSGMAEVGAKAVRHVHFIFDAESGDAIASAHGIAVSFDLVHRKAVEVPPEARAHYLTLLKPQLAGS